MQQLFGSDRKGVAVFITLSISCGSRRRNLTELSVQGRMLGVKGALPPFTLLARSTPFNLEPVCRALIIDCCVFTIIMTSSENTTLSQEAGVGEYGAELPRHRKHR